MSKLSYIDLRYKPSRSDIVCEFYIEPASGLTLKQASEAVAKESSIGTWTELSALQRRSFKRLKPSVFNINTHTNKIKIAYPIDLFELGNIPQFLSSVAGNVFGMKAIRNLRLEDIQFSRAYFKSFKGPAFGVQGVRKLAKVQEKPLLGTIIKPKIGLSSREHAKMAYDAWVGGCNIVKDDENLSSQKFNPFRNRVASTLSKRDKAERETGEKKLYFPNITAPYNEMVKRARYVKSLGGEYVMIDILTAGWSALQSFRNLNLGLAIHAHRAGHAMFTRNPKHGVSMLVLAKLARLVGVDTLHTGTAEVGKMKGENTQEINLALTSNLSGIKPVLPVASGGLYPGALPKLLKLLGYNIVVQAGGSIHGHPQGTRAGATAMRQAIDSIMLGLNLNQYASTHKELREALEKWG